MRLRVKFGLVTGFAVTVYLMIYAALQGGGTPFGLVVGGVWGAVITVITVYVTSRLIDKRWPDLGKRK